MKTYLAHNQAANHLILKNDKYVYILWDIPEVYTIDLYKVLNEKIINGRVLSGDPAWLNSKYTAERLLREIKRDEHPEINPKQFLTHHNPLVRKIIKKVLSDESIPNS